MSVSTKLERIAKLAKQMPGAVLTTLAHHIDIEWLQEAHRRVRKDGATGVDGQTADGYAKNLEGNLQSLLDRAKSGDHYRAPPVRRVNIPKGDGSKTRPIGIPTFEDKVLQKAVAMVLEAVYEQDFLPCSYGFRPGRGAHDALQALWEQTMTMGGGWVFEADIESFFDSVDHAKLRDVLSQRVCDGVLTRLVGPSPARLKAASSRRFWRTSTCTRCSTCGGSVRCGRGFADVQRSCDTRTTS